MKKDKPQKNKGVVPIPILVSMKKTFFHAVDDSKRAIKSEYLSISTGFSKKQHHHWCRGFTLVEVILYVSIAVTILSVSSVLVSSLVQSRVKSETVMNVEQQGAQVMSQILNTIRNAEGINSPTIGNNDSSISIDALGSVNDPTIFNLVGGIVYMKEGVNDSVPLTNSRVQVSGLNFNNVSRLGTPGIIKVEFIVDYINISGRNEYNYTKNFYGSASLR